MKPRYPSFLDTLLIFVKSVFFQAGIIGSLLVYCTFPVYTWVLSLLKTYLGDSFGNDRVILVIMLSFVHTVVYVFWNGIYIAADEQGWFVKYKLPRKPYMTPSKDLIRKTFFEAALGQLVTSPSFSYFLYDVLKYFKMTDLDSSLPGFRECFFTFCFAHIFNDFGFYWTHRLLHSKWLYEKIHKQHHEYKGTVGYAAEYAHPVEVIFSNMVPTLGGVIVLGTHPLVILIWMALRLQQTYEAHSGFCFEGTWVQALGLAHAEDAAHHDYHHTVNVGNFGCVTALMCVIHVITGCCSILERGFLLPTLFLSPLDCVTTACCTSFIVCHPGVAGFDVIITGHCSNLSGGYTDWLFGTMDTYVQAGGMKGYINKK